MASDTVTDDTLALAPLGADLKVLLRHGLPLRPEIVPDALTRLNGAVARSVDPDDRLARLDGLEKLLRAELKHFGVARLQKPAGALFGLGGAAGGNLTERRHKAATLAGYQLDHFRKRIEPQIVSASLRGSYIKTGCNTSGAEEETDSRSRLRGRPRQSRPNTLSGPIPLRTKRCSRASGPTSTDCGRS